jgi:hypothetical protein
MWPDPHGVLPDLFRRPPGRRKNSKKLTAPNVETPVDYASMNLPTSHLPPPSTSETPSAIVRVVTREDVLWDRPVFKAPPLKVSLPAPGTYFWKDSVTTSQAGP